MNLTATVSMNIYFCLVSETSFRLQLSAHYVDELKVNTVGKQKKY